MTRPPTFTAIVQEANRGMTIEGMSRRFGVSADLAEVVVDEAERLGLLRRYGKDCSACGVSAACRGCPLSRVGREA